MENEKLKRGQEIELIMSDLAFGGQGISKLDDLIVKLGYKNPYYLIHTIVLLVLCHSCR